jgi:hypothetical protein
MKLLLILPDRWRHYFGGALMALVGSFCLRSTRESSFAPLRSPDIHAVARDFESTPKWRTDVRSVTSKPERPGSIREEGKRRVTELMEDVPARRTTRITDTILGYAGKWTYVSRRRIDTRVTITEDGVVSNVIFRFLSRYAFGHTATIDTY